VPQLLTLARPAGRCRQGLPLAGSRAKTFLLPQSCGTPITCLSGENRHSGFYSTFNPVKSVVGLLYISGARIRNEPE
jgi:hypothetical protein